MVAKILVIDDDVSVRAALESLLTGASHEVISTDRGESALALLASTKPDLIILDVWLPGISGIETLRRIKGVDRRIPVVVITGSSTMDLAVEASKLAAFVYEVKPLEPERILQAVSRALDVESFVESGDGEAPQPIPSEDLLVGQGPEMQTMYRSIGRVATSDATVLIRGESGSGKSLVAQAIHRHSRRAARPLLSIHCASVPDQLLEGELFGWEQGEFDGSATHRTGLFQQADGATIFLKEVGRASRSVQAKLLCAIRGEPFMRIGGGEPTRSDVRLIASTSHDLELSVAEGSFDSDLFQHLRGITIRVPPLRDRRGDLPALAAAIVARLAAKWGASEPAIAPGALALLQEHSWPGNVRELEDCLRSAFIFGDGAVIQRETLKSALEAAQAPPPPQNPAIDEAVFCAYVRHYLSTHSGPDCSNSLLDRVERQILLEALTRAKGNQTKAAELLGLARPTLHGKLQKHGIRTSTVIEDGNTAAERPA